MAGRGLMGHHSDDAPLRDPGVVDVSAETILRPIIKGVQVRNQTIGYLRAVVALRKAIRELPDADGLIDRKDVERLIDKVCAASTTEPA